MENILFFLRKYCKDIILFGLIVLCLGFSLYALFYEEAAEEVVTNIVAITDEKEVEDDEEETQLLYVDIKGAVNNPGVYEVFAGMIVSDVVELAGGFLDTAYQNGINLSKKVSDEMVIYVYTQKEISASSKSTSNTTTSTVCEATTYDISDCVEKTESIITTTGATSTSTTEEVGLININTATQSELETLSGIGSSKAAAIIEYRTTNGNFASIEEIKNVSGIGDAIFDKIKDYITV